MKHHRISPTFLYPYRSAFLIIMLLLITNYREAESQPSAICSGVCDLAWSPVEELLVAVNVWGLWLYQADEVEAVPVLIPLENATSLSFDPTGRYIAVTSCLALTAPTDSCHGSISLFDIQEQAWIELGAYDYSIGNVKFSPDGRYVAFQKDEIREWGIQLIDLTTPNTFTVGDQDLTNLAIEYAFDPQSTMVAVSNGDIGYEGHSFWGLSVWRISDQTLQARTEGGILAADLTFTETENNLIFVGYDTEVFVWNYQTDVISSLNKLHETVADNVHRLSFSSPPNYLLAALLDDWHPGDRMLFVWDIQSGEEVFFRDMPAGSFADLIAITPTDKYIAVSSTVDEQKLVGVRELTTGATRQVQLSQ